MLLSEQEMADRLLATGQAMTETEMADRLGLSATLPDLDAPQGPAGPGTPPRPPRTR
jgi:hypothetical protein